MFEGVLQRLFDQLVPARYESAIISESIRARFFIATAIFFLAGTFTVFFSWLAINNWQMPLLEWGIVITSMAIQLSSLYFFRFAERLSLAAKLLVWSHYGLLSVLVMVSGGIHSPFMVAFVFMPVFCAFVINAAHCKAMLLSSVFIMIALSFLDVLGIAFPYAISENVQSLKAILFAVGLVLIIVIFASYEMTLDALKTALIKEKNRFLHFAEHDDLTGLLSYKAFEQILDANYHRRIPFALFYVDLDNFKTLNHQYGHATGDRVLQQVAARISNAIRNDDIVARVHSDEFAIIINDINEGTDLEDIAKTIKQSVSSRIDLSEDEQIHLKCSVGYYDTLNGKTAKSTLISIAKSRMQHADESQV